MSEDRYSLARAEAEHRRTSAMRDCPDCWGECPTPGDCFGLDDSELDDPRHGQAGFINAEKRSRG